MSFESFCWVSTENFEIARSLYGSITSLQGFRRVSMSTCFGFRPLENELFPNPENVGCGVLEVKGM